MPQRLPTEAAHAIRSYLRVADRLLPDGIIACAVTGSIALGAYRPGRSDIDLVAVISDEWRTRPDLIRRLRLLHLSQLPRLAARVASGKGVSACCNTAFVWESDVSEPVTTVAPIASHTGEIFEAGGAFDVNPVVWKELKDGGITVRGRPIADWELDAEPDRLRPWVKENLREYWSPLAAQLRTAASSSHRFQNRLLDGVVNRLPARLTGRPRLLSAATVEWCLLGPARMHHTLMTGEIIGKEEAGRRVLDTFPQHSPITEVALATVRAARIPSAPPRRQWRELTASAMEDIIAEALRTGPES
ncbi:nucleotidyltransferase domain-containing protein [Brevibacterium atlanticum]|uniref:nucleotidyltransferase domain-containing protein n=1 Tax=Brevibacterium atlanticum TaxID=2697563 RepID=UPI00142031B7|nr:nucleotidyltransferase domain-containing protein [Brevibacterium atlanticum]